MNDDHREQDTIAVGEDFASIETPEELRPHRSPEHEVSIAEELPQPLERARPKRAPLVPTWVWVGLAVLVGLTAVGVGIAVWNATAGVVDVPEVVGVDLSVAESRLAQAGLEAQVVEERFSTEPPGEVLEQSPEAGERLKEGEAVELVVSAGTEEFAMPDVVGDGLALARGTLEERGLVVEIELVTSNQPSDTVLASVPAPGVTVRIGDAVRLQVASPKTQTTNLRPYRLQGLAVTIDPAPSPKADAGTDVTLEVARRLRALLEASGATVAVLRSGTDTATPDAERATEASNTAPTVAIGLSTIATGQGGRTVGAPAGGTMPPAFALRDELVSQLATAAPPARAATLTTDPVLGGLTVPWARVILGSYATRTDETSFSDSQWADEIARAIYVGLGEVFGTKEGL